jgi:hypothetical protein
MMETLWSGFVSFAEDDFPDESRFPHIQRLPTRSRGRKGLTGGRLFLQSDGMHWKAGSILTPGAQLHGTFYLPWNVVASIEVKKIPFNANFLGRALLVHLHIGPHLYGEFLGSQKRLRKAIEASPVG